MTVRPAGVPNRALWGLFVDCITSGRYPAALTVAEKFCNYAAKSTDPADAPDRRAGIEFSTRRRNRINGRMENCMIR